MQRYYKNLRSFDVSYDYINFVVQVGELKSSLSEAHELATSSTGNLERHEAKHQQEVENMRV